MAMRLTSIKRATSISRVYCSARFASYQLLNRNRDEALHYWNLAKSRKAVSFRTFSSHTTVLNDDEQQGPKTTIPYLLADIGEGIAEVELLQWFVNSGDTISQFDRVCEVQSDKATVEITSRYDGVVESLNGEVGDMLKVGSPLLHVSTASGDTDSSLSALAALTLKNLDNEKAELLIPLVDSKFSTKGDDASNTSVSTDSISISSSSSGSSSTFEKTKANKVLASPAVRKLGMEYALDLGTIVGTGPKDRVLKADVLKILKDSSRHMGEHGFTQKPGQDKVHELHTTTTGQIIHSGQDITVPIRGYTRLMVKSMTASLQIPQMVYADEISMTAIRQCRAELKPLAESHGVKLSYLPFCLKAASLAMKIYPALNSSFNEIEGSLTYHGNHNIGVAMDTPRGLAVPVVKACQDLTILEIATELTRLQDASTQGKLSESDISDATFALSNIGAIGGTYMTPIVSPPQVAIGAMGKLQRLPRFVGDSDTVEEVHIMHISWSGDHRVIDGATMARFSNKWKAYMESPISMIFSLK